MLYQLLDLTCCIVLLVYIFTENIWIEGWSRASNTLVNAQLRPQRGEHPKREDSNCLKSGFSCLWSEGPCIALMSYWVTQNRWSWFNVDISWTSHLVYSHSIYQSVLAFTVKITSFPMLLQESLIWVPLIEADRTEPYAQVQPFRPVWAVWNRNLVWSNLVWEGPGSA